MWLGYANVEVNWHELQLGQLAVQLSRVHTHPLPSGVPRMVPLPQIHYDRLRYGFSLDAANFGVLVDIGTILLVIGYVLVHCQYDKTEASYLEPPTIVLTGDTGSSWGYNST